MKRKDSEVMKYSREHGVSYKEADAILNKEELSDIEQCTIDEMQEAGKNFAEYPFDQCIRDQIDKGHDEESAKRICGAIKAKNS